MARSEVEEGYFVEVAANPLLRLLKLLILVDKLATLADLGGWANMPVLVNGLMYILSTGCQRRAIPNTHQDLVGIRIAIILDAIRREPDRIRAKTSLVLEYRTRTLQDILQPF